MPALIWIGAGLLATIAVGVIIMLNKDPRQKMVDVASGEEDGNDALKYWMDVIPGKPAILSAYPNEWCGAFALWALHQAGMAKHVKWVPGIGFLSKYLTTTHSPQPGDIAYFHNNQHHAIVKSVNEDGTITLINGNGSGRRVTITNTPRHNVDAFYSIQPFVDPVT